MSGETLATLLRGYQTAVGPAVLVAYALAAVALTAALRGSPRARFRASAAMALLWAWVGVAWFALTAGPAVGPEAWFFAGVFLAQAVLIPLAAWRGALRFGSPGAARAWLGLALVADATIAYPLSGWLEGTPFPAGPMFGVTPWPVVVFTVGMLLLAEAPLPKRLLVLPLLFTLAAVPGVLGSGHAEDLGMAVASLTGIAVASLTGIRVKGRRAAREAA